LKETQKLENAIELYKKGQVTGWKAARLAGISLWCFYDVLAQRGVLIQYSERDLEEDLKPLNVRAETPSFK